MALQSVILPPSLRDGQITMKRLALWARVFDEISEEDGKVYTAAEFVAWLKPETEQQYHMPAGRPGVARLQQVVVTGRRFDPHSDPHRRGQRGSAADSIGRVGARIG